MTCVFDHQQENEGVSRRQLLRGCMFGTIGLLFGLSAAGGLGMLWPTKVAGFGGVVTAPRKAHELAVGDVVTVREGKYHLTRTADGLMALYWKCVHLGCTVPWNPSLGQFVCPCHASAFAITGQNLTGPAARPLDAMALTIAADGTVLVDTGRITRRTRHEPGHALPVSI